MKNTIGIIILVFLLTGCATTKNFNSNDKGRIESISVTSEHVKFKSTKDIIFLNTDAKAWAGLLAGPIGALVYGSMDDHTPEAVIYEILNTQDLLKNTVAESFKYHFERSGLFSVTSSEKADAYLEIDVRDVQFHEINGDKLRYTGLYFASIYDSHDNSLLWTQHEYFSAFNSDLVEYELDDYIQDPGKLKYAASIVSQMLAREFIEMLDGKVTPVDHVLHSNTKENK